VAGVVLLVLVSPLFVTKDCLRRKLALQTAVFSETSVDRKGVRAPPGECSGALEPFGARALGPFP
jgi:hypothetical protein